MHVNVLIIGGGISGLTLAYKCIKQGYNVIIFEKTDRLGGKINSIYHNKTKILLIHDKLISLLKEFNIPLESSNELITYNSSDKITDIDYVLKFAKTLSDDKLKSINFNQLCSTVLGPIKSTKIINSLNNSEQNAYDVIKLIENNNNSNQQYLCLKQGFQELINKLRNAIIYSGKAKIMMSSQVTGFINKTSYIQIKIKAKKEMHIYKGDILVSTIPKNDLLFINKWTMDELNLINSVDLVSLHRINGNFDNNLLQIKSNPFQGLAMVSYWNNNSPKNDKELRKVILESSQVVFPDIQKIHKPKWVNIYNWNQGINIWKNNIDSQRTKDNIQQMYGKEAAFFIIGDTYNNNQGWIEGSLESIDDIFPKIIKIINSSNSSDLNDSSHSSIS